MADVQLENGYTRIANEIIEALVATELSGQELRVVLFIIRKLYGYHKTEDTVPLSQISSAVGVRKVHCSRIMRRLEERGIIIVVKNDNGLMKRYRFNKDFEKWQPLPKLVTVTKNGNGPLPKMVTVPLPKLVTSKESIKEKIKEKTFCAEPLPIGNDSAPEAPTETANPAQPPVMTIPLIRRDGEFRITQQDIDQWQETFPAVDVVLVLRRIRQWNLDNPDRRKTQRGIRKHISGWLAREQDRGRSNQVAPQQSAPMCYRPL